MQRVNIQTVTLNGGTSGLFRDGHNTIYHNQTTNIIQRVRVQVRIDPFNWGDAQDNAVMFLLTYVPDSTGGSVNPQALIDSSQTLYEPQQFVLAQKVFSSVNPTIIGASRILYPGDQLQMHWLNNNADSVNIFSFATVWTENL